MFALATNSLRTAATAASSNAPKKLMLMSTRAAARNVGSIAVGTDMLSPSSSHVHLQKARPWHRKITESNLAVDNAVSLQQLFGNSNNKIVGVFGIPAPFTGTCSCEHYPGYQAAAAALKQAGCDELVCYAVTDPYTHHAWKVALQNDNNTNSNDEDNITFLADPDASFAVAYGLDRRYDEYSLGLRSERFRMLVVDGVVTNFALVEDAAKDAQEMLRELQEFQDSGAALQQEQDEEEELPPAAAMSS